MSVAEFQRPLDGAKYPKNDLKCFPLGLRRYPQSVSEDHGRLPVSVESVKAFSRSLLDTGTPAWQRLQPVRAVEAYRDLPVDVRSRAEVSEREAGVWLAMAVSVAADGRCLPCSSHFSSIDMTSLATSSTLM